MASEMKVSEVLKFLDKPKERRKIEKKFNLSKTSGYNLISWLKKAKLIKEVIIRENGKGRVWRYKKC